MEKKIKIIHVITGLRTGGAEMMLYKLLTRIDRKRFDNLVVSLTGSGKLKEEIEALGVPLIALGLRGPAPGIGGIAKLAALLKKTRPHILQSWLIHSNVLGLIVGKLAGVPRIVWNIRGSTRSADSYPWRIRMLVKVGAGLSRYTDAIIVNSIYGEKTHRARGYRTRQWKTIANGFDLDRFKPAPASRLSMVESMRIPENAVVFGLVARFHPVKDHETFLNAARLVVSRNERAYFILAGSGIDQNNLPLADMVRRHGIEERVRLLGEYREIHNLLPALDVVCSSSREEGFSNVIGEAMACGVPCISTDAGDSKRIIGDTGLVVPPKNPEELAGAMLSMIDIGHEGRYKLGEEARMRIEENFDIGKIAREYESFYELLAGGIDGAAAGSQ